MNQMSKFCFKRPCIRCDELFRPTSKNGRICDKCNRSTNKTRNTNRNKPFKRILEFEHCSNCGILCCGNFKIEARRGVYYPFCVDCFNLLQYLKMKDIRKLIKKNKAGVIV